MHVEPHHTAGQLAELIRSESRARVARRLAAVRLARLGGTAPDAARRAVLSERRVRAWVSRYNAGGAGALADRPGRGRKRAPTGDQERQLRDRLGTGPTGADGVCTPRGEDVRRILGAEFGVVRCPQAVYDLPHRLGFEPPRARPRHPGADPAARERFKKASRPASPRSPAPAGAGGSRCGSRTRRGSGRRGR